MEPISHLVWMTEHMNLDREKEEAKEENALIDEKKILERYYIPSVLEYL